MLSMPLKLAAAIGSLPTLVVVEYGPSNLGPGNGPVGGVVSRQLVSRASVPAIRWTYCETNTESRATPGADVGQRTQAASSP
jgi:hypothetical protein